MNLTYIQKAVSRSIVGEKLTIYYFTTANDGVGIDMYIDTIGGRTIRERKISDNLFSTTAEAKAFVDKLHKGLVTPCTLQDIIDDIL